jgi:tripartite-type tricarboxylate transporter receptor subunit TctC
MTFARFAAPAIAGFILAAPALALAQAQDYPTRPVTLVAPWPAGGAIDTLCRILGPKLSDRLGKPVIIENRAGAASVIGTAAIAKAAPDGYMLVMGGATALAVAITVYKKLPYDPTKDFAPITLVSRIPFVLVAHPSLPVRSIPQLIQFAKEKPGQLSYASGGPGSRHHLYMELLKSMTGIEMMHIPYKGNAPAASRKEAAILSPFL